MDSDAGELAARWRAIAAEQARVLGLVAGCRAGTSDDDELSASGVSKALKTVEIARAISGDAFLFVVAVVVLQTGSSLMASTPTRLSQI